MNYRSYITGGIFILAFSPIYSSNSKDTTGLFSSCISKFQVLNKVFSSGNISLGYEYGAVPIIIQDGNYPTGFFRIDGNTSVNFLKLPFHASWYYTNLKNISGLNNYFRISFNAQQYRQQLLKKVTGELDSLADLKNGLINKRQQITQKLLYTKHQSLHFSVPDSLINTDLSLSNGFFEQYPAFSNYKEKIPSGISRDSLNSFLFQSLSDETDKLTQKLADVNEDIKAVQSRMEKLRSTDTSLPVIESNLPPYQRFFSSMKKFEIGMCYPDFSPVFMQSLALKGISFEWNKDKLYLAFAHGKTINNLLYTNNLVTNQLNYVQNAYNFFDFGNVSSGRSVTAIRGGIGSKEGTHIFIGYLYGAGLQSYSSEMPSEKEYNQVAEIDAKLNISKSHQVSFQYGKSFLQLQSGTPDEQSSILPVFGIKDRTNAAVLKWQSSIATTKTKVSLTGRIIDPFFKSYGLGFVRSDNLRYEVKVDQSLGKKLNVGVMYRKDQDNLLGLLNYKNTLESMAVNLGFRVSKKLNVRAVFHPVVQNVEDFQSDNSFRNNNLIANGVVTYNSSGKNTRQSLTAVASYYSLSSGSVTTVFQNFSLSQSLQFKSFANNVAASYFYSSSVDTLAAGSTLLLCEEFNLKISEKNSVALIIKYTDGEVFGSQTGGGLRASTALRKNMRLELSAEKVIAGDFYNSFNQLQLQEFPFYCSSRLIISW